MPRPKIYARNRTAADRARLGKIKIGCDGVGLHEWREAKVLAIVQGISMSELVTRALNMYADHVHNGSKKSKRRTS